MVHTACSSSFIYFGRVVKIIIIIKKPLLNMDFKSGKLNFILFYDLEKYF
jgi:hypothetical protein